MKAIRRHHLHRVAKKRRELAMGRELSDNQLATRHPMDCGNPGCLVCHSSKVFDNRRAQWKRDTRAAIENPDG